ncbi:glycoside hydrolase family 18 protein [Ophiostoma piceae UAMH 11346]|uniref:chitinase n=1 Tax=Ophiostoma piceae (strain UAMH 11346) TaxID=1262450 RepID=S3CNI6_OPHP1|nr:glycoside hydrolase family 18 protein [Ophiostoma piceae UAMH 11346]
MPSIKKTLLAAATASVVAAKSGQVNVYYGQQGSDELATVCESGVDYVTLAFVNVSPENGGASGYAGDNFANHCWAGYYDDSVLLKDCPPITNGWQTCKDNGVKLILSIGGVFSSGSNYTVSTDANAVDFANFLWGSFGPYDPTYDGPRPFDVDGVHNSVDGFDFDIEEKFDDESTWNTLITTLRAKYTTVSGDYLITAAPQCPYKDSSFQMTEIIAGSKFDIIWVQFYNNPVCDGLNGGFNFDDWVSHLDATVNSDTPIFIGLPASENAAGSGYLTPKEFEDLIVQYRNNDRFGGVMLWDEYFGFNNEFETPKGESNYVQLAIGLVDGSIPGTVSTGGAGSGSGSGSGSGAASSGYTTSTVRSTVTSTILSCAPTVTNCPYGKVTTSVIDLYTTVCPISEAATTPAAGAPGAPGASAVPLTVSTIYSTSYETITSCAPEVTNCPARVSSHVVPVATTTIYAPASAPVVGNVAVPSSSAVFVGGHYSNSSATLVTVVAGSTGASVPVGASSPSGTAGGSRVPTAPSSPVTAGAGKVSSQVGLVALLAAGVMMML